MSTFVLNYGNNRTPYKDQVKLAERFEDDCRFLRNSFREIFSKDLARFIYLSHVEALLPNTIKCYKVVLWPVGVKGIAVVVFLGILLGDPFALGKCLNLSGNSGFFFFNFIDSQQN